MKCVQFFSLIALIFLPTPTEGTLLFIDWVFRRIVDTIFFTNRRNERDCQSVMLSTGLNITNDTEECSCATDGYTSFFLRLTCPEVKDKICLSPSDEKFCAELPSYYEVETTKRRTLSVFTSPLITSELMVVYFDEPDFDFSNTFYFTFYRSNSATSSSNKTYTRCRASSSVYKNDETNEVDCTSCEICENGVDFTYDCYNVDGTYAYNKVKDRRTLFPGPKVKACFPVAEIFPTFTS